MASGVPGEGSGIDVDFVEVADEPHHVEHFRNDQVRSYLATIEPGESTLYHRHQVDTLYVVVSSAPIRTEEPGNQPQRTRVGRSTPLLHTVGWALTRAVGKTPSLPTETLLMQYHRRFPLVHRIRVEEGAPGPLRMLGVELLQTAAPLAGRGRAGVPPGWSLEFRDRGVEVCLARLAPGQSLGCPSLDRPALLVVAGGARWVEPGMVPPVHNPTETEVVARLITPLGGGPRIG